MCLLLLLLDDVVDDEINKSSVHQKIDYVWQHYVCACKHAFYAFHMYIFCVVVVKSYVSTHRKCNKSQTNKPQRKLYVAVLWERINENDDDSPAETVLPILSKCEQQRPIVVVKERRNNNIRY